MESYVKPYQASVKLVQGNVELVQANAPATKQWKPGATYTLWLIR